MRGLGAVVALDPRTGEILAMVSRPTPDPNDFAVRISAKEWKQLNDDPLHPLLNRAIQAQLAPGSVFKIVTATAMLEDHSIPPKVSPPIAPATAPSTAANSSVGSTSLKKAAPRTA